MGKIITFQLLDQRGKTRGGKMDPSCRLQNFTIFPSRT